MSDGFTLGGADTRPAISHNGRTVSYAELDALSRQLAPGPGVLDLAGLDLVEALATIFAVAANSGTAVLVRAPDSPSPVLPPLPNDAFLVAMTSGTSGRPRAVVRTAKSWAASFPPVTELTRLTSDDVVLMTGPLHSTLHLFAAVHTLWLGAQLTDDPAAATAAHVVPSVLHDLLVEPPTRLRTVVVAGAVLPGRVEARALDAGLHLVEYYGAAELSFVAARIAPGPLLPFPGVEIRIDDGRLWARSPYLAMGRVGVPPGDLPLGEVRLGDVPIGGLSAGTVSAGPVVIGDPGLHAVCTADGFATAGDLAEVDEHGRLTIRGRGDAAVTTGGHTILVEDVEAVIGALPGVTAVAVVGLPHSRLGQVLTAVVELAAGTELTGVRRAARTSLTGAALPRRWQAVEKMPRTGGGKISRANLIAELTGVDPAGPRPLDTHDV